MTDAEGLNWSPARKRPALVEAAGPFDDARVVDTLEGDYEVDDEYLEEHGAYYLVRGVQGEVYPVAADVFRETYETTEGDAQGWYFKGQQMTGVRIVDTGDTAVVSGYTVDGLVAYEHEGALSPAESLEDYCRPQDAFVRTREDPHP